MAAWASIVEDERSVRPTSRARGHGGFVRSTWDEVNEIIAAANAYTVKKHGPDRVIGFSPIPAMSMVSYAAGALSVAARRRLRRSTTGIATCRHPRRRCGANRPTRGSADWYNAGFSSSGAQRTADPHARRPFLYGGALKAPKRRSSLSPIIPRRRVGDSGCPKQGTDAAPRDGLGSRHPARNSTSTARCDYFRDYVPRLPTCRCWCVW